LNSIDEAMPNIIKELKLDLKCKRREKREHQHHIKKQHPKTQTHQWESQKRAMMTHQSGSKYQPWT
jgi:hypothetical protein